MPVGTNATIKALHPDEVAAAGASIVLANTYHLYLRPGHERIRATSAGSTRSWAGTGRSSPTRAGSRSCSLGDLRVIDDDGVTFKSHLDGSIHRFTPEHSIAVQEALGPDIAVAFDQPVFPSSPRPVVRGRDATGPTAGPSGRSRPTRGRTRRCSASSRAGWTRSCARSRRGSSRRCRSTASTSAASPATRRRSERNATLDATVAAPRRRPAAALPDGPRLAARPARRGPPGHRPVRLGAAGAGRAQRPAVGPGRPAEPPQRAVSWTIRGRSRRAVRARSAPGSRGPIWPICSGPRRCSRTGSRLVTT